MKKMTIVFVCVGVVIASTFYFIDNKNENWGAEEKNSPYQPSVNPTEFTTNITNPFFTLPLGRKLVYQAQTNEGTETIEILMEDEHRIIMGVEATVYRDKVWLDGQLVEDTKDYLAQDEDGNVWYFGEEVDNYENGQMKDHTGSWIAGENGALPGIWIKAKHVVDDSYRQEYYPGEAEDMRDVVAVGLSLETKIGNFTNCVQMYDWTPLDPHSREHKYYCPGVGAMVLTEHVIDGDKLHLQTATPIP